MNQSWGSVLTELIPLALVIALVTAVHHPRGAGTCTPTGRARPGWPSWPAGCCGLAALVSLFVVASDLVGSLDKPPSWASWLRIVVGAALIVFGGYKWATRKKSEHSPAWMRKLSGLTPGRAVVTAAVLAVVNPKVLFICIAAGLAIGTAGIGVTHAWLAMVYFVLIAGSTVILPDPGLRGEWGTVGGPVDAPEGVDGAPARHAGGHHPAESSVSWCCTREFTDSRSPRTATRGPNRTAAAWPA